LRQTGLLPVNHFGTGAFFTAALRAIRGQKFRGDFRAGARKVGRYPEIIMRLFTQLSGRRVSLLLAAGALALGLAACAGDSDQMDATGSPFTQALFKDYSDLANQAAALPADAAPAEDSSFWGGLNPFSDSPTSSNELLTEAFTAKAKLAAAGTEPEPEAAPGPEAGGIRARLMRALAAGKEQFPDQAARAQTDYDCWVLYGTVPSAAAAAQACKTALDSSLPRLEAAGRPVPPPVPVVTAPVAAPAAENTVYFDFDSWRLSAEDLTVITNVINTARAGGQTNITVVGHTDTSGDAAYNQKLSTHRANVVAEALVDMGARRKAIHTSGVGEADLAVQTPDGVKEAKNRRAVITLQP
jgi:OOP family OmpA-OmpF porin